MSRASADRPITRQAPVRTCIGCRGRAPATELLRVVAGHAGRGSDGTDAGTTVIVPDPRRRLPGRGAWVHCTQDCVAVAERRRAFVRALRVSAPVDLQAVREHVASRAVNPAASDPPTGQSQYSKEQTSNGHPMKHQR